MAPLSACDLTVELELPPGRPFWTNGDALRGQVLLELAVPADRLGDNSVDQVRIDGEVKVAYGWDATRKFSSSAASGQRAGLPRADLPSLLRSQKPARQRMPSLRRSTARPD